MIGCYDGERYANFPRFADFLNHVCRPEFSGVRWFAHNGGRYDSNALFDFVRANRPDLSFSFFCAGSCVVSLTLSDGPHKWRFCDSYRLLDASLKKLTDEFDVEHKKGNLADSIKSGFEVEVEYNRNDCIGLYEVLERFFAEFGAMAETVAAFALQVFKLHFLTRPICKVNRKVENFIRRSYYGGRCEVYRWNPAELRKMDVNSLYPSVMREPVPVDYEGYTRSIPDDDSKIGFYQATIDYPDTYLPALPAIIGGRLFFPVGKFDGFFTSMELRQAITDGAVVSIEHGVLFRAEPVFREFAETLFDRRREAKAAGNLAVDWVCKKVLNSCYGKFGQRREQRCFVSDPGTVRLHPMTEEYLGLSDSDLQSVNPRLWPIGLPGSGIAYYEKESRASHILPHISSAITSRARLVTGGYLRTAGRVWYTDTDSVFTDAEMRTGDRLGDLKLEGVGRFEPFGLKEYSFDGHYSVKGISITLTDPDTGEKTEHPEIAESYLRGERLTFDRRAGFMESIRENELTFRTVQRSKERRPRVEKRARYGTDTRAWEAGEIME